MKAVYESSTAASIVEQGQIVTQAGYDAVKVVCIPYTHYLANRCPSRDVMETVPPQMPDADDQFTLDPWSIAICDVNKLSPHPEGDPLRRVVMGGSHDERPACDHANLSEPPPRQHALAA